MSKYAIMRRAYTEINIAVLNKILKIPGATIIGGRVSSDNTLRLFLVLEEESTVLEKTPAFIPLPKLDEADPISISSVSEEE